MGIGVEAVITHGDLALVRYMGSDPGDELQVGHPLHFSSVFPIAIVDSPRPFSQGEPLQGQKGPDHVFSHPLGLVPSLGPDPAVGIETRVPPGEEAFGPFRAEELPADKISEDLSSKDFRQSALP
jgi:hypothetical protein